MGRKFSFIQKNYAYIDRGEIHVVCRFSRVFVEDCRQIEGRRWNATTKTNSFPLTAAPMVKALAQKYRITLPEEFNKLFNSEEEKQWLHMNTSANKMGYWK